MASAARSLTSQQRVTRRGGTEKLPADYGEEPTLPRPAGLWVRRAVLQMRQQVQGGGGSGAPGTDRHSCWRHVEGEGTGGASREKAGRSRAETAETTCSSPPSSPHSGTPCGSDARASELRSLRERPGEGRRRRGARALSTRLQATLGLTVDAFHPRA